MFSVYSEHPRPNPPPQISAHSLPHLQAAACFETLADSKIEQTLSGDSEILTREFPIMGRKMK